MENILAGVYDNKTCLQSCTGCCKGCCYITPQKEPEQQQQVPQANIQPYLKIVEEPGDTRFRYF